MLAIVPILCFAIVFDLLWRRQSDDSDPRGALLSAAIIWGTIVAILTEALSLFNALSVSALAVGWGTSALVAALVSFRQKEPTRSLPRLSPRSISPLDLAMVAMVLAIALVTGFIAFVGWPNNWDGLNYHLSRVAHWAQNGSVAHYPTHITHQLFYPPWASYATLHLTLLGGDERFANLVQWFSMLGSVTGVSLIAQRLGANARGQLVSALFAATIPMGILQASSIQADYVATFWLVCLVNALLTWRDQRVPSSALAVGASLGLALLSRQTAYLFFPPLGLLLLSARRFRWPGFLKQAVVIALLALALNIPHYLRNLELFGTPIGPTQLGSATVVIRRLDKVNDDSSFEVVASNLVRNLAWHFGSPFPALNAALERSIKGSFAQFGYDLDDPRGTYFNRQFLVQLSGPNENATRNLIHALLIGGAVLAMVCFRRWRSARHLWSYALALALGVVLLSALIKWEPQHSRLTLPIFVLWSPLIGLILQQARLLAALAALVMTVWAWPFLMQNYSHPLLGEAHMLRIDRHTQYFQQAPDRLFGYAGAMDFLDSAGCDEVGLIVNWFEIEYPFWVLLPRVKAGRGRIEHVGVQNVSARLESRRPPFWPCAVVEVNGPAAQTLQIGGAVYRRAWSGSRVAVFEPSGS